MLGGWAYGAIYRDSNERNAALAGWLDFYNRRRPHGALSHKPPLARLNELNNLLGSYQGVSQEVCKPVNERQRHAFNQRSSSCFSDCLSTGWRRRRAARRAAGAPAWDP